MLLSLIRMIQAFRDYQRNVSDCQLSDRELADIGLDRSDIPPLQPAPITADRFSADC